MQLASWNACTKDARFIARGGGGGGGVGVGENFFFDKCVGENCMHIMMENLGPCGTQGFNVCMQLVPWQNLYR